MHLDAERHGARYASSNDPRVLPGCAWMRRSHADELPQLWNVLLGQMTLVGPRPERPEMIEELRTALPGIERRLASRPGITGLAQVLNGYTNDVAGARRKLAYDLRYLRRQSMTGDFKLLLRTLTKVWDPAALVVAILLLSGCTTYTDYEAFIKQPRPLVTSTEYRLGPPDVIAITSKRVREVNGHTEQIRPDGKITLPLLGTVNVAGRTVEEVAAELQQLAAAYYDDADANVQVVSFRSKKIYVFGEVGMAGAYPYDGANTVLETLAVAQPTRLADPNQILVLRPNPNGELIRRMTISLDDMVKEGDTALDAVLEEGDILYVPPNALAAVGLTLQQLLLPIQPAAEVVAGPGDIDDSVNRQPYTDASGRGAAFVP